MRAGCLPCLVFTSIFRFVAASGGSMRSPVDQARTLWATIPARFAPQSGTLAGIDRRLTGDCAVLRQFFDGLRDRYKLKTILRPVIGRVIDPIFPVCGSGQGRTYRCQAQISRRSSCSTVAMKFRGKLTETHRIEILLKGAPSS